MFAKYNLIICYLLCFLLTSPNQQSVWSIFEGCGVFEIRQKCWCMCVWQSLTANVKPCEPTFVKTCKNELQRISVFCQQSIFPRKKRNALLSKLQINLTTIREEEEEDEEERGKTEDQRGHFNQRCVQICVECN